MPATTLARDARTWTRDQLLKRLGYPTYQDYIASPEWAAVKARYRASSLPQNCAVCDGAPDVMHHKTYENVGKERLTDIAPLCDSCHTLVHELDRRGDIGLDFEGLVSTVRAEQLRPSVAARRASQRAEYRAIHRAASKRKRAGSLCGRLRQVLTGAERAGIELGDLLDDLDAAIVAIEQRVRRPNSP
jgi:hypothetical protein